MRSLLKLRFVVLTKKENGRRRRDSNPVSRGSPPAWLFASLVNREAMQERTLCSDGDGELL